MGEGADKEEKSGPVGKGVQLQRAGKLEPGGGEGVTDEMESLRGSDGLRGGSAQVGGGEGEGGGVAYNTKGNIAATVTLQSAQHITRSAFDMDEMTVNVNGVTYVISPSVQCYNKTSETWFTPGKAGLEAARAYSDDLTLYFDRSAAQGGKIRLVEVP